MGGILNGLEQSMAEPHRAIQPGLWHIRPAVVHEIGHLPQQLSIHRPSVRIDYAYNAAHLDLGALSGNFLIICVTG